MASYIPEMLGKSTNLGENSKKDEKIPDKVGGVISVEINSLAKLQTKLPTPINSKTEPNKQILDFDCGEEFL